MSTVKIRLVDGAEWLEELAELQRICLPNDKLLDPCIGDWWIAFDWDAAVGFACLRQSHIFQDVGYLARAGVLPSYRGLGLQKRLIRVRLARAKRLGMRWVRTDTYDNPASSNSLVRCGFQLYTPTDPWGIAGTLYFRKKLAA